MASSLRRSQRSATTFYDSNGRDYLADKLRMTRNQVEIWLSSPTVHPHLLLWYKLCTSSVRFEHAIHWLDSFGVPSGYTLYQGVKVEKDHLESDLRLLCLMEGNIEDLQPGEGDFLRDDLATSTWSTQSIWARTAWRIVQANRGPGYVFEKQNLLHPPAAYACAIDILCLAFHSIAHRRASSVWYALILHGNFEASPLLSSSARQISTPSTALLRAMDLDRGGVPVTSEFSDENPPMYPSPSDSDSDSDSDSLATNTTSAQTSSSSSSGKEEGDLNYNDFSSASDIIQRPASATEKTPIMRVFPPKPLDTTTPEPESRPQYITTPKAPPKSKIGEQRKGYLLSEWLHGLEAQKDGVVEFQVPLSEELLMIDERGVPITGYRRAVGAISESPDGSPTRRVRGLKRRCCGEEVG